MAIQRWEPLRDLLGLQEKVNRLFEESLARSGRLGTGDELRGAAWNPAVDLFETPDRYVLRADIPGTDGTGVELAVGENDVVLRGERRPDPAVPRESYLRLERPTGEFQLRVSIPASVDRRGIEASHRNGVLEVVLPKKKPEPQARIQVSIQ